MLQNKWQLIKNMKMSVLMFKVYCFLKKQLRQNERKLQITNLRNRDSSTLLNIAKWHNCVLTMNITT